MTILEQEILHGKVNNISIDIAQQRLSAQDKKRYESMIIGKEKSKLIAWLLWFFFGMLQFHLLYLDLFDDKHHSSLRIFGLISLYFLGFGLLILIPLWIYDAFKINSYHRDTNNMIKAKILNLFKK